MPLVLLSPTVTFAQSFPTQPVRIVAATPPGGAADVNARRLADKLSRTWKQPVVVIASLQRSAVLPDIPTFEESGLRRFESVIAHGVLVPAKTPDAMVMTLNRAINETLHDPQYRKQMADFGADLIGGSAKEFRAFLAAERGKWGNLIKKQGIKAN